MKAPSNKPPRTLTPQGTFLARVVRIIYIGTIKESYMGEEKEMPKIMITWELPTEKHVFREEDGPKPFTISKEYTHSMGKKSNLRPVTEAIIGASLLDEEAYNFDHDELLGKACQITIKHDEKESGTWEKVTAVSPVLKGVDCPAQVNPSKVLSFDNWNEDLFESLPNFIKNKIVTSKEYIRMKGSGEKTINTDDIPFD